MNVIKKRISIVTLTYSASKFYENQIKDLFGEFVVTSSYSLLDGSIKNIENSDIFIITTDAFNSIADLKINIPFDIPKVEIEVTYTKENLETLMKLPKGSKALFVNLSEIMVRESIARLNQLGINHIEFTPYYPGAKPVSGFDIAVTVGESQYAPDDIKTVIDLGHRVIDSATVVEIALRLNFEYLLERQNFKEYFRSIAANNYSFDMLFGKSLRMESQFEILMDIIDDGIIGVNESDIIFACNSKALEITNTLRENVIDHSAKKAFPFLPFEKCKKTRKKIENNLIKVNDVDINISVTPVIRSNEYIGAFATIQKFTEEESKQHNLRIQLLNKGHKAKYVFEDIIGESEPIKKACAIARKMAKTNSSVLITGESGTGKELFAHAIHNESKRRNYPFIAINCAAMPDNLLESELFGYEEGSFTGARKGGKLGLFEFAHKGTIFLDEVEAMSPSLQVKLLRVIQEREIMRVGGNKIISIDVRIIATSNESLENLVAKGSFRTDLYYRLNTLPIQLPPLSERGNDIILLFEYFKNKINGHFTLSTQIIDAFMSHNWNGNIRELRNYVEYFTYLNKDEIFYDDLPPSFYNNPKIISNNSIDKNIKLDVELLEQLAGNGIEEYHFVLNKLYDGFINKINLGRLSIAEMAETNGIFLTQQEVRNILIDLSNLGLIKMTRGRGGSKINNRGIKVLKELNNRI
ncbi:sigma-54 interaction domain-containing protein [Sedimentibacter sp. MB31-C6]|uniref:sigma-54 interaction domain-containing protein n=1 Tax=Sedimentibacter sp. MB31-C6 TaxID=3109366 RepID=UPI002DDCC636|nr:sigma 54-interacting transcriptional regulator [Sedimentibacter sp. MB36-C1]WSI05491.1 sigma 54-interacting transcriptional regulator [Sedimentibacter sp. MB36-C1]